MEAPAPADPEDHLKVLPESYEKQTKLGCSNGEGSGAPEDSNTAGEGTEESGVSSTTAKPAANPTTEPLFLGKEPPRPDLQFPTCAEPCSVCTIAKVPRKVIEKHRDVNV